LQQATAGRTGSALGAGHKIPLAQGASHGPLPGLGGLSSSLEGLRLSSSRPFSSPLPAALLGSHMEAEDGVGGGVAGTEAPGLRLGSSRTYSSSLPAALLETHKEAEDGGDAGDAGGDLCCALQEKKHQQQHCTAAAALRQQKTHPQQQLQEWPVP
jgi:hypothetical protein